MIERLMAAIMEHQVYDSLSITSAMIREYLAVFLPKSLVDTTSRRTSSFISKFCK